MYILPIPHALLLLFGIVCAVASEIHGHVEWCKFGYTHLRVDCRWHATIVLQVLLWYMGELLYNSDVAQTLLLAFWSVGGSW